MKNTNFYIWMAWLSVPFFAACQPSEIRVPRSVGITSEILVVVQNKDQWKGRIGDSIKAYFGQNQYGLPQDEPIFRLANVEVENFSDMFKKHRNLFLVEINPKLEKAVVESKTNVWADPQQVTRIMAPNTDSWLQCFAGCREECKLAYDRAERARMFSVFRPLNNGKLANEVFQTTGIKLLIPEGYYIAKNAGNFIWLRREFEKNSQGIFLYTRPYHDTAQFSRNQLVAVRDSVLQLYVPGPSQGSFMSTDKVFITPQTARLNTFVTDFAVETRGAWNVVGDFMGGPFVSYTFVDPHHPRMITVEGYVFAPNQDKRDLLRQLEALLYSVEIPNIKP